MHHKIISFLFVFLAFVIFEGTSSVEQPEVNDRDEWLLKELSPYFLPPHHPVKKKLDKLFSSPILDSVDSFIHAGFEPPEIRSPLHTVIGKHKQLKGYLIKFYFNDQPIENEGMKFLSRIHGAEAIDEAIHKYGFEKDFRVPKKWLYPLPNLSSIQNPYQKRFILVVEDLHILPHHTTKKMYREHIKKRQLKELFILIKELELIDSIYISNIPFNDENRICFIDTEWVHAGQVNFSIFDRFLSKKNQIYWHSLIDTL